MRSFKIMLLVLMAASLMLLPALGQAAEKDTLVYGTTAGIPDSDPATQYIVFGIELNTNTMPNLLRFKANTNIVEPDFAESYTVSQDGLEYTFKLREGLKFPDGTPCDANVVKHSIDRLAKLEGLPSFLATQYIDRVEVVSPYVAKIVLKNPLGFFPTLLPHSAFCLVNPNEYPIDEAVHFPTELPGGKLMGLGAYNIISFKRDEEIVLEANPNYYGPAPKIDRIVIRFYADATTMRLALEKGELDFAYYILNWPDYISLEETGKFFISKTKYPLWWLAHICTTCEPFNNKLVRQAFAAAIDRAPIAQNVFLGLVVPTFSYCGQAWDPYYKPTLKTAYGEHGNVELARELLAEAGYDENNKCAVELWYTPTVCGEQERDHASMIKRQMEATGVFEVTLQTAGWATYIENMGKEVMPAFLIAWIPDFPDPENTLGLGASYQGPITGSFFSNKEWDEKIAKAASLSDPAERKAYYDWIQDEWVKEVPILPLFQGYLIVVSKKEIAGFGHGALGALRYEDIHRVK